MWLSNIVTGMKPLLIIIANVYMYMRNDKQVFYNKHRYFANYRCQYICLIYKKHDNIYKINRNICTFYTSIVSLHREQQTLVINKKLKNNTYGKDDFI